MQVLAQLKSLTPERFLEIYTSLEHEGYGPLDGEVAKSLKFRPIAVKKLPIDQRAKRARMLLESMRNTDLAYELFGAYLIKKDRKLVTDFLDKTGVAHEDGMLQDVEQSVPHADKIATAVQELDAAYPPADVTLYLSMCAYQWPQVPELDALWKKRSG